MGTDLDCYAPDSPLSSCLGAGGEYLLLRRPQFPTSKNGKQDSERREERGVTDLTLPGPLVWEEGEGERREEQQQLESQGA